MYGPVPTVPSRGRGARARLLALRVVLTVVPVPTLGLAGWMPMLRLALAYRRRRDWALTALTAVAAVAGFALVGSTPEDSWPSVAGMVLLLGTAFLTPGYFLAVELRPQPVMVQPPGAGYPGAGYVGGPAMPGVPMVGAPMPGVAGAPYPGMPPVPPQSPLSVQPVAYFQPAAPVQQAPVQPAHVQPAHVQPVPAQPAPVQQAPVQPVGLPGQDRIGQVRAGLDELSAYLQQQDRR